MIVLRYDPTFSKRCTFFVLGNGTTIRARMSEASSEEVVTDIDLRWRKARAGAQFFSPVTPDLDVWAIESCVIHTDLARTRIQLADVPDYIANLFKTL